MKSLLPPFLKLNRKIALTAGILCIFLFVKTNFAEAQETTKRAEIGLVLSGGGAHGIAHLGIIKVMEEAGLRPDYITGVSMGSIIGGMYSLGYTADSLYKILKEINWSLILANKIPENKVIFLEKGNFDNSILALPLSYNKVHIPSGLINGQQVESTLNFYAWPAADINDFSKLPIPFLCMATDIIKYKRVVLKSGYLPDAIRASFSVPSIFTAYKLDTLLLLDGGLIRNFAASEAREMGADILIGSYVGFEAYTEEELQSVSGIVKQIAMFRSLEDFEQQKELVDLLIKPDISGLSITDFENVDSLYQRGYKSALPYKDFFIRLADSLNQAGIQKPVENILDKEYYSFDEIKVNGNNRYSQQQVLGVLDIEPNKQIDKYMLKDRIELLYGKAWFDKIKYRIVPGNDSLTLYVDCIEKPPAMLYGSVHYDNYLTSGLIIGFSVKNLLTQRSVINTNSFIGQYYRIKMNYIQFIDRNQIFGLSANFYTDNTNIPMLEVRGEYGDVSSRNFISGLSLNQRLGLNHMMNLSANYENLNLILRYNSISKLKSLSYNYFSATYEYQVNTLDTKHFPDRGNLSNISIGTSELLSGGIKTDNSNTVFRADDNGEFSFDRFYTINANFRQYITAVRRSTFLIGADILFITDSDSLSAQNNFHMLGGVESVNRRSVPAIGFHSNQIAVKKMAGIRSELDYQLYENIHLSIMANYFIIQETNRTIGYSLINGYGIGLGYQSLIGPIKIGIEHGNYSRERFFKKTKGYISIGYNF
jgi:NTE family protein